jgi:hypothetical protein
MFKVMMNDLSEYKKKAEMSKQLATYFSPFSPIQTFSQENLFKEAQIKDGIINVEQGMKNKDVDLIKKMEKEILALKDVKNQNEALNGQLEKEIKKNIAFEK